MSEPILLEDPSAPLAPGSNGIEHLEEQLRAHDLMGRAILAHLQDAVSRLLDSAAAWPTRWATLCRAVGRGQIAEVQAMGDRLRSDVEDNLARLQRVAKVAVTALELTGKGVARVEEIPAAIAGLEQVLANVFGKWQTQDDLVALAVRDYPLATERVRALARAYPPPQEWYDEEENLF